MKFLRRPYLFILVGAAAALSLLALLLVACAPATAPRPEPLLFEGDSFTVSAGEYRGLEVEVFGQRRIDGVSKYVLVVRAEDGQLYALPSLFSNRDIALSLGAGLTPK